MLVRSVVINMCLDVQGVGKNTLWENSSICLDLFFTIMHFTHYTYIYIYDVLNKSASNTSVICNKACSYIEPIGPLARIIPIVFALHGPHQYCYYSSWFQFPHHQRKFAYIPDFVVFGKWLSLNSSSKLSNVPWSKVWPPLSIFVSMSLYSPEALANISAYQNKIVQYPTEVP